MVNEKSEKYLNENIIRIEDPNHQFKDYGINSHEVVLYSKAHRAVLIAEEEIKNKATEAFRHFVEDYCKESGISFISNGSEHYLDVFKKELDK
ncbi:hypothetical protein [uncultured Bacteroides sp.]|uniref:hypothetical protein n=1 Tax=uncultured Bacteroides sp. TaxID=162156 RepID=UPI002AAA7556|nr:hypothetical protein [uncultured Bacteroides sp.]